MANLSAAVAESGASIQAGELPTVAADAGQLTLVFQNLIGNAIKYRSAEPPTIRVNAGRGQGEWIFSVTDNGMGVAAEYHQTIFGLFKRLQSEQSGTGLGLAICKRIVEQHGGRIWVESTLGAGATFRFTLPVLAGADTAADAPFVD